MTTDKELLLAVDANLLDEVISWAFLSAIQYSQQLEKKQATKTQYEAIENTKRVIRELLKN